MAKKEEICGAYGGTITRLGQSAEIICQRSPGHPSPHRAAPYGWPQVWSRPVVRNPQTPARPKPSYRTDRYGHFDDLQKSCYVYGCTDDCPVSRIPPNNRVPESALDKFKNDPTIFPKPWWKRVLLWFRQGFRKKAT